MEFVKQYKATLEQLYQLVEEQNSLKQTIVYEVDPKRKSGVVIRFGKFRNSGFVPSDEPHPVFGGEIFARETPGGDLIIRVKIADGEPNYARQCWEELEGAMLGDGWIAAPTERPPMQAQSLVPTNAPKIPKWSRDQITFALLVGGFFVTLVRA